MKSSISVIAKRRRGRPATTGTGTLIGVRLLEEPLAAVDKWAVQQADGASRPEAIRRLVELGLAAAKPRKGSAVRRDRAVFLAAATLDKQGDATATAEERGSRRTRLLKGPGSFRDVRKDRSK
jgi:hypothetical protein